MNVMLTSFGIEQCTGSAKVERSLFYQMPPVSFRRVQETFMPDFALLLICEKLIMDGESFSRLAEEPFAPYTKVAETFRTLKDEGRIELADFSQILKCNATLLEEMVVQDVRILDHWIVPLRDSLTTWRHFATKSMEIVSSDDQGELDRHVYHSPPTLLVEAQRSIDSRRYALGHEIGHLLHADKTPLQQLTLMVDEALNSSAKRKLKEHRKALRDTLCAYLKYVNANLILSNQLEVGFHDWLDFTPFYRAKFLSIGKRQDPIEQERKQVERLFTLPFPDLAITNTRSLMKALNDKRIADLRQLISDAVSGKVQFDHEFAKTVLSQVWALERKAKKWRNILGYLTLPIGLIPWAGSLAEKAVGEAAGAAMENKLKKKHRWFYMLSEIAESDKPAGSPGRASNAS